MSTEDNKALAERLIEAWNARDFETAETLFAPDYVNNNPPPMPGIGGDRAGQVAAMKYLADAFPNARAETNNVIAEGDMVVLHDTIRGAHEGEFLGTPPTGRDVTFEFIHIFRVADGKIVERWGLIDAMSLLGQLGALPEQAPATTTA